MSTRARYGALAAAFGLAIAAGIAYGDGRGVGRVAPAEARVTTTFAGAGRWSATADARAERRGWHVDAVQREDGSVRAKLSVPGVAALDGLTIEGQMVNREAFGVLLDEQGREVTSFNATLGGDGGGSFILGNGQAGIFEYGAATRVEVRRLLDVAAAADARRNAGDAP